jgi:hypothetical protein
MLSRLCFSKLSTGPGWQAPSANARPPLFSPAVDLWLPFEQTKQERVIYHAQKQAKYRPNETATYPRFGNSDDIVGGKSKEGAATKARTNKDGSSQRREGENNAAQLLAETAESPEGIDRK